MTDQTIPETPDGTDDEASHAATPRDDRSEPDSFDREYVRKTPRGNRQSTSQGQAS